MAPLVRRTWAPKGSHPVLYQRTGNWEKITIIAALAINPSKSRLSLYFRLHSGRNINSDLIVSFLKLLLKHLRGNIVLVWDGLAAHRSKKVRTFLRRTRRLRLVSLPPYAPELNPAEYIWSYLKRNPLANLPFPDLLSLAKTARRHTKALQQKQKLLRSFLRHSPLSLRLK
jgi:putative transposase